MSTLGYWRVNSAHTTLSGPARTRPHGLRTRIDGKEVGTGRASSFTRGAFGSAAFLFELMAKRGIRLEPGQWISSGAVTGVHDALPGQLVECEFEKGLKVSCRLTEVSPS